MSSNEEVLTQLPAVADTTLRLANRYASYGNISTLSVSSASVASLQRSLIRFDQASMVAAVGGQALHSAKIELRVVGIAAGWLGGQIEIMPMTRTWPEGNGLLGSGPSWVCTNDTNTTLFGNLVNNCTTANNWGMLPTDTHPRPFNNVATDRAPVFTGGLNVVTLNVTEDVRRILGGTMPNHGWILAGTGGPLSGEWANFAAREAPNGPKLLIEAGPDQCPQDPNKGLPGQCGCGVPDLDLNYDDVADCVEAVVSATADTTVRLAVPFGNDGTGSLLGVTSASVAGLERTLVRVDQVAIDTARQGRHVDAAYLELTIAGIALGWGGGRLEILPMTRDWPEGTGLALGGHGPSWFCADDKNTTLFGNLLNDCLPTDVWAMEFWQFAPLPFSPVATDTQQLTFGPGRTSVRFDVTADVQRFIGGAPNHGWLVKGTEDLLSGQWVNFGSRESGAPPRLLLDLSPLCSPGVANCPPGSDRDTDGDRTRDQDDPCVLDPLKVDPGYCGCHKPETDSDDDGTPNCIDPCPDDPNNTDIGPCGCVGETNLQPAGMPCVVEACSGSRQEATCDGQGRCGVPSCTPGGAGASCVFRPFRNSGYWFCQGPVSWQQAETFCNAEPGRSLAKIDGRVEDDWITDQITVDSWLGGNDLGQPDRWYWSRNGKRDGTLFYADGLPIPGRFEKWGPAGPESSDCLTLLPSGAWLDRGCSAAQGYVCEQPLLRLPPRLTSIDKCNFYPGLTCPTTREPIDDDPCVDESTQFPGSFTDLQNTVAACTANCQVEGAPGCATSCPEFAEPPPFGQECLPFTGEEQFCRIEALHPGGATCSVANPSCPDDYRCGPFYECAALDVNQALRPCTADTDCDTALGHRCGTIEAFCIDPEKHDPCADRNATDECVGQCFRRVACGTPAKECAANDDEDLLIRCSETLLCSDGPDEPDTDPRLDPESRLQEEELPDGLFPDPPRKPGDFPLAKPDGCGGDGEPACNFPNGDHPWCRLGVDVTEAPDGRTVSEADTPGGDRRGSSGSSGPLRFDFDPNLQLSYNVTEPLPLGDAQFNVGALASATASVQFNLFGIRRTVSLLDALAQLDVDRCGLTVDARLKLLGHDFLPAVMGDSHDLLEDADTPTADREACQEAVEEFRTAVNQAQKALRDAQELIRQHNELVAKGERLTPDLCHLILESGDKGVPSDFPSASAPFAGCGSLTPDETINLFVRYYREKVSDLIVKQAELFRDAIPEFPTTTIPFLDQAGSLSDARRETQQVANVHFTIGPVPMNLTVEVFLQYGLAGALTFALTPQNLLNAYRFDTREEVANVDASITPFAASGVTLFVGVGFDWDVLSAKVGISGDVFLGNVSFPLYAGAGVGVQPELDDRALPEDLKDLVASADALFPPGPAKRYRFDAYYKFGATASIRDILKGEIFGKVRVKFFWFSKTWKKRVARFKSLLPPVDLKLIAGKNGAAFAEDFGILGAVRMPVVFVDLAEVDPPPPLPPLPPPGSGGAGGGGPGGAGGTGAGGAGAGGTGAGGTLGVALHHTGDPRYAHFDESRVDQLFYDGYCACGVDGQECTSDLDCCGSASCVFDDRPGVQTSTCATCIAEATPMAGGGQRCEETAECCQNSPSGRPVLCYPFGATGQTYCQACRGDGEPVSDANGDGVADHGECCAGFRVFHGPLVTGGSEPPICMICRAFGQSCNERADCCDGNDCLNGSCGQIR